ncbi:TetR/AcrR family transcriptional regulator [Noviherbaspirillum suwonense]|uniref:Transcriptional regulator, TetR family n=1 Tax=Noviherbaspirillum suwonense TaxID=1224511 RepID=A0ABY1PVW1_9BURK|nr:TetR/AcrR family transcriptional regulator [Noviherbaspirillum suwonense]SMP48651.1 transcriptional regulator, TetR family [Noviherbaspirillum suwonense]
MSTLARPVRKREVLGARSERRVKEILGVARQVFSENGYENATTLDIARQAGISEATVFSYFTSKRDLCMQVIKGWYDEISLVLEQEVPMVEGTRAQLHFVVHKHLVTLMQDGTGMCKLVLSEGRSADADFAGLIAELKRRYTAPLMKVLAAAQRSGEVRQDMPLPLLRDMVYGSMEHVLWDYMVNRNKPDIATTAGQLTDMLWTAFVPVEQSQQKLAQFREDVAEALRRLEN